MLNFWNHLYGHYRDYHAYGPPRLKYVGYIGAVSSALFYLVRFTRPNASLFDDAALRALAVVLFLALALKDRWPDRLKPYYIAYSYVALLYCLPCFTVLAALQRGGGVPAISNTFIVLSFLVLLTDWRNTLVMLFVGVGIAGAVYAATNPHPRMPMELVAQLPAFALIAIGGNLFKFSTEQIDAERKLRATQALAGSIAHEMRNPLGQLKYSLEGMQRALPAPTVSSDAQMVAPQQLDDLYRLLAQGEMAVKRGLQVIAMTLDEVGAKPVDASRFECLSAATVARKAVQEYGWENDAERERVSVDVVRDFDFRGEETAFLFVLFNLMKNALYYLALHPEARISITVDDPQVRVRDTGPGMTAEQVAHAFQPFASAGKTGGTGLGLAYCQRVMRAFGGGIECESVFGRYTQFTLEFPPLSAEEVEGFTADALRRGAAAFGGKRLLIVDDQSAVRMTTRHNLQPLGAVIDEAADGQSALEMLARQRYDLMLLDLNMPGLDGYSVAEKIRRGHVPGSAAMRIVAHTSEQSLLAGVKVRRAGMEGIVTKPSSQLALVQALLDALAHPISPTSPDTALPAGFSVLLADDNAFNRKAVGAYLRHAGARVIEAAHGQAVVDHLLASGRCDAILMDINMPGMDGLQAARAIRASHKAWADVPIIALTAYSDSATIRAAAAAGMNDFITKPVEAALLYQKLRAVAAVPGAAALSAAPSIPAVPAAVAATAAAPQANLLDSKRLESYTRIGMLTELLTDYLPEIGQLVQRLERSVAGSDLAESLDILHSLVGMSGEAGAAALHLYARAVYVPMLEERRWPAAEGWLDRIRMLAAQTDQALRAYGAAQPRADLT
jgi:two-component system, CAI-1 autoinducer sensor kinase/phosphatase CqsS